MFYFVSFLHPFPPSFLVSHSHDVSIFCWCPLIVPFIRIPVCRQGQTFTPECKCFEDVFRGTKWHWQQIWERISASCLEKGSTGHGWWNIRRHRRELQCSSHPRSGRNNCKFHVWHHVAPDVKSSTTRSGVKPQWAKLMTSSDFV